MSGSPDALLSRVEAAGIDACAPPQQRWLDGWLLRFSPGKAQRARCIHAVAAGSLPLAQKLGECERLYDAAGLPMLFRITPFSQPPELDSQLARLGWQRYGDSLVMVCSPLRRRAEEALPAGCQLESVECEAYAHIVGGFRGTPDAGRQAHAERLRHSPVAYRGLVLWSAGGQPLACAQAAMAGDLVGLYDVHTAAESRGQGLARRLCARLLQHAMGQGASTAYLQVDAGNAAARAVYRRLGFADAYGYHYRARPDARS